jgi:myosin-5
MELGDEVWVRHPTELWIRGTILKKQAAPDWALTIGLVNGEKKRVRTEGFVQTDDVKLCNVVKDEAASAAAAAGDDDGMATAAVAASAAGGGGGGGGGGKRKERDAKEVDDLISLMHLHEPAILHALEARYNNDMIYTSTGPILIAVNPFKRCDSLYTDALLRRYEEVGTAVSKGVNPKLPPDGIAVGSSGKLRPHPYWIADRSYRLMVNPIAGQPVNQSVLVSGESGAGKTVTTKIIVRYLATIAKLPEALQAELLVKQAAKQAAAARSRGARGGARDGGGSSALASAGGGKSASARYAIEEQVVLSNPILESFGNARTIRNDNSSRFGKFITIQFNRNGYLVGASISTYLLEKARIVFQADRERNYHIFYEMAAAATAAAEAGGAGGAAEVPMGEWDAEETVPAPGSAEALRLAELAGWRRHLTSAADFHYANQSNCFERLDGVADDAQFGTMVGAMRAMGASRTEVGELLNVVAAVAHLGNVWFDHVFVDGADGSQVAGECEGYADTAAQLLGVERDALVRACCTRIIDTREGQITVHLDSEQAVDARDALAKAAYQRNFAWLVQRVNQAMAPIDATCSFIGVLDIFGFEVFEFNGFEQLCINYANETLQQQFNEFVFKMEQAEYERERIEWSFVDFPDNKETLELIEGRHAGLLDLMDEESMLKSANPDTSLAGKFYKRCGSHPRFSATKQERVDEQFVVRHYAGDVCYSCEGLVERNRDRLNQEAIDLLSSSSLGTISAAAAGNVVALPTAAIGGGGRGGGGGGRGGRASISEPRTPGGSAMRGAGAGRRSSIVASSVSSQFKAQLAQLLATVRTTSPHYVRCLKPNDQNVCNLFNRVRIVEQLACGGVLEAVRVSRAGFPIRLARTQFLARYFLLRPGLVPASIWKVQDEAMILGACRSLLEALSVTLLEGGGAGSPVKAKRRPHEEEEEEEEEEEGGVAAGAGGRAGGGEAGAFAAAVEVLEGAGSDEEEEDADEARFRAMCRAAGVQVGLTKVFFRNGAYERLEAQRSRMIHVAATRAQAAVRAYPVRWWFRATRAAAVSVQCAQRAIVARRVAALMRQVGAARRFQRAWRRHRDARRRLARGVLQRAARVWLAKSAKRAIFDAVCALQRLARCRVARGKRRELFRASRETGSLREQLAAMKAQVLAERKRAEGMAREMDDQAETIRRLSSTPTKAAAAAGSGGGGGGGGRGGGGAEAGGVALRTAFALAAAAVGAEGGGGGGDAAGDESFRAAAAEAAAEAKAEAAAAAAAAAAQELAAAEAKKEATAAAAAAQAELASYEARNAELDAEKQALEILRGQVSSTADVVLLGQRTPSPRDGTHARSSALLPCPAFRTNAPPPHHHTHTLNTAGGAAARDRGAGHDAAQGAAAAGQQRQQQQQQQQQPRAAGPRGGGGAGRAGLAQHDRRAADRAAHGAGRARAPAAAAARGGAGGGGGEGGAERAPPGIVGWARRRRRRGTALARGDRGAGGHRGLRAQQQRPRDGRRGRRRWRRRRRRRQQRPAAHCHRRPLARLCDGAAECGDGAECKVRPTKKRCAAPGCARLLRPAAAPCSQPRSFLCTGECACLSALTLRVAAKTHRSRCWSRRPSRAPPAAARAT